MNRLGVFRIVGFDTAGSRRAALRGLAGAGLAAALVAGGARRVSAHGVDEVARDGLDALREAITTGDEAKLDALFAADVAVMPRHRLLKSGEEVAAGLPGLKAALADIRSVVSDIGLEVGDVIADERAAAGRITFRGVLGGATEPLTGNGLFYAVVSDDRIAELWLYPDPYVIMTVMKMGMMATPMPMS